MFKNPIRFFINIQDFKSMIPKDEYSLEIKKVLSWSTPIKYSIRKHYKGTDIRYIHLPNIRNFIFLHEKMITYKGYPSLTTSLYSRMKVNLMTGDFDSSIYKGQLENDLIKLVYYDKLLKLDITAFYDSIYTHTLSESLNLNFEENYITNLNSGKSHGILKGPYTSLYLAESFLRVIIEKIRSKLNGIPHNINFFSDDIYIFTDDHNVEHIKTICSETLVEYGLILKTEKIEKYNYEDYSNINIIDKYWNAVVRDQKKYEESTESKQLHLNSINQLLYRMNKLKNPKHVSIFIKGFFKSSFFIDMDIRKYELLKDDLHKILYIYKEHPETILYSIYKFKDNKEFKKVGKNIIWHMFDKSLDLPFHEEQMYYFYALQQLEMLDTINEKKLKKIIDSKNQILISYFVVLGYFNDLYDSLLNESEEYWFLNYHILMMKYKDGSKDSFQILEFITKYLVPKKAKGDQIKKYTEFYLFGIEQGLHMINLDVDKNIQEYLQTKKKSTVETK